MLQNISRQPQIGRALKAHVVLAGLRVADVAAEAEIGPDTLYRIFRGVRPVSDDERGRIEAAVDRLSQVAA